MDKLTLELRHCGTDVDTSRHELLCLEIERLVERFGYTAKVVAESDKPKPAFNNRLHERVLPADGASLAA